MVTEVEQGCFRRTRFPVERTAVISALKDLGKTHNHSAALPRRAGAGRPRPLERATRCEVTLRHASTKPSGAGKSAQRFTAASSVSVIRVDPKRHRRIGAPERLSPKRIPYSPHQRAQRGYRAATIFRPAEDGRGRPVPARRVHGSRRSIEDSWVKIGRSSAPGAALPAKAGSHADDSPSSASASSGGVGF